MIKLYDAAPSGNCHKARLMLSLLGLEYETVPINLLEKENRSSKYLAIHPLGRVPALDDDGTIVWDGQAIVVYLAKKYGSTDWYPEDAAGMAEVQAWLAFAAREMWEGPAIARAIMKFKRPADKDAAIALANAALGSLEDWFEDHEWLACGRPTVADVAVYPYAAMAWEGEVDMDPYDNLNDWIKRVEALPGYVGMENMPRPD